jgi:hypothetical protein
VADIKLVVNSDTGTADLVGGNDWDGMAVKVNAMVNRTAFIYDVIVWKDTVNSKIYAFSKSGSILSQGTAGSAADDTVIQAAINATPANGTLVIMPSTSNYIMGQNDAAMELDASINISAYGATFQAGTTLHQNAIWWQCHTTGIDVRIFGGTYNSLSTSNIENGTGNSRIYATLFGCGFSQTPHLLHLRDLTAKNFYSNGISIFPPSGGATPSSTAYGTIIVENCLFDAVPNATFKPSNECIVCANNIENFVIKNTYMNHTKGWFVVAENLKIDNCIVNATGWPAGNTGANSSSMCQNVELKNVRLIDAAMTIRMHGNPDDSKPIGQCKNVIIDGFLCRNVEGATWYPIQARGYYHSATTTYYNLENVTIRNAYFDYGPIIINRPTGATTAAKIKHLKLENIYFNNCRSDIPALLYVTDQNIDFLELDGIYFNPGWGGFTDPAIVRVYADNINSTVSRCIAKNVYPAPLKASSQHLGYLKADSSLTATITFDRPLIDNSNNCIKLSGGAGTETGKFTENWGSTTFTGNASTTAFNIAHLLNAAPAFYRVTADTDDALAPFSYAVDSTNITITYPFAPPTPASGSDNLSFRWEAKVL